MLQLLFCLLVLSTSVTAQSVIISAPNTDITPKGEVMLAHESQWNRFQTGNYWNSFTFGTYGLSKNTELAATLYGLDRPATGNVALGVGLKHRWLHRTTASGWQWEGSAGFMSPLSVSGRGLGGWGFGNVSVRAPGVRTRVTVGPSYGSSQIFGRGTYSTLVGLEQPVSKQFSLVADWFSGTHDLAAAIGGFAWHPRRELVVILAYKVPNNAASGKPAPLVELTYNFTARRR